MTTEIAHGAQFVTGTEVLLATLSAWHPMVTVYAWPQGDPLVEGVEFRVYAVSGGVRTLIQAGKYTLDSNYQQSQRVLNAVRGAGQTIELRAITNGQDTTQKMVGVIVGWDPGEQVTPDVEADTATHTIPGTFSTLSQWYPLVDALVDGSGANPSAIGSVFQFVASFPSIAGFPDCVVDAKQLTSEKQTIFLNEATGAETFYIKAITNGPVTGNVTVAIVGHTGNAGVVPGTEVIVNIAGTSSAIIKGNWLSSAPGQPSNTYTKATLAAQVAAGGVSAIALSAAPPGGQALAIKAGGNVPTSVSGLGPGAIQDVAVNDAALSFRVTVPSGSEFLGGVSDALGGVIVAPSQFNSTATYRSYNPKSYGAFWDSMHDDLPGLQAMIAAIKTNTGNPSTGAQIDWPAGEGYVSNAWDVDCCIDLTGRGGGGNENNVCRLRSAPGKTTIHTWSGAPVSPNPNPGTADFCKLGCLNLSSSALTGGFSFYGISTPRVAGFLAENKCAVLAADVGNRQAAKFFRWNGGGTGVVPGNGDLPGWAAAVPGDTFVDGPGTWTCEAMVRPRLDSHAYQVGDRYMNFGANKNPYDGTDDLNAFYFECTIAGTSGDAAHRPAALLGPHTGLVFSDGTATFITKVHAAIQANATTHADFIQGSDYTNSVMHYEGQAGVTGSVSLSKIGTVYASGGCGMGMYVGTSDANGVQVDHIMAIGAGLILSGLDGITTNQGGLTALDHSQGGGRWGLVSGQTSNGRCMLTLQNNTVVDAMVSENSLVSKFGLGAKIKVISDGAGHSIGSACIQSSDGFRNLRGIDTTAADAITMYLGLQDGTSAFQLTAGAETATNGFNWKLPGWPQGWWGWTQGANQLLAAFGVPGNTAKWPSGVTVALVDQFFWVQHRLAIGLFNADPPTIEFGAAPPATNFHVQGSICWNNTVVSGQPEGWRCTVTGTPGTWSAMANHP